MEDNKPEGLAALRAAAQGTGIEVVEFPTKYPSGGEKQLIEILTGKQVPSGGLPSDVGVICQNVGSAVAVSRCRGPWPATDFQDYHRYRRSVSRTRRTSRC